MKDEAGCVSRANVHPFEFEYRLYSLDKHSLDCK